MAKRLRTHVRSNLVGYVAIFIALGGTGAWAVDKITSKEIAKSAVRSKHIAKQAVRSKQIKDAEVKSQDIDPAVLAGLGPGTVDPVVQVVQGDARLISAHDSYAPQSSGLLLDIPGLGRLETECRTAPVPIASIGWENTTGSEVEFASEGRREAGVVTDGQSRSVGVHEPGQPASNEFGQVSLARGTGAARTTAIVHAVPIMLTPGGTCSFQAHVILSPSG